MADNHKISDASQFKDLRDVLRGLLNRCNTAVGLAEGTNNATVLTANTAQFCINGVNYTKAGTDNLAISAGSIQAVSTYCKYLVVVNASGTVSTVQGNQASTAAAALVPDCPVDKAPLGYFQIATDATHTYTPGTTDNGAAGITDTYVDLGVAVTIS